MTSFRFHTNFTNPLKITHLAHISDKVQLPQTISHPPTPAGRHSSRRCLSSTDTDVVVLEAKPPQTSIGLKTFSQGLANSCRGETVGIHPSPHLVKNRANIGANLQGTQHPVDRITGRPLVKITDSLRRYSTHAWEVFKFAFSKFAIQMSDCKEQLTML